MIEAAPVLRLTVAVGIPARIYDLHVPRACAVGENACCGERALRRLRLLQSAIVDREEQGQTLSRLLPGGLAQKLRDDPDLAGRTERKGRCERSTRRC